MMVAVTEIETQTETGIGNLARKYHALDHIFTQE